MKKTISGLRDELNGLRKQRDEVLTKITQVSKKLSEAIQERNRKEVLDCRCTAKIAAYWDIPKLQGSRKQILSRSYHDILPIRPASGSKDKRRPLISRLHHMPGDKGALIVADVVRWSAERLCKSRCGVKTLQLLNYCLSWNGLSLGMEIDESKDIDPWVRTPFIEFVEDVPSPLRELMLEALDPQRDVTVAHVLCCSRISLRRIRESSNEMIDMIEKKLALRGRKLRTD